MTLAQRLALFLAVMLLLIASQIALDVWGDVRQRAGTASLEREIQCQLGMVELDASLQDRRKELAVLDGLRMASPSGTVASDKLAQVAERLERLHGDIEAHERRCAHLVAQPALAAAFASRLDQWGRDGAAGGEGLSEWLRATSSEVRRLDAEQRRQVQTAARAIVEAAALTRRVSWIVLVVTVGAALITGVWFARYLYTALRTLGDAARAIGAGELERRIEMDSKDELATLANAFNQMAENLRSARAHLEELRVRAEQANAHKSRFLANMSHELRTPMNAIIGYSEMLLEEFEDQQVHEYQADVAKIRGAGRQLLELINDVLDLSKIEAGKLSLHPEPIDLDGFLEDLAMTIQPMATARDNQVQIERGPELGTLYTDRLKLRQILLNLLSNACKFTRGGRVALRISTDSVDGNECVVFEVEDEGIGMTAQQLEEVFDEFAQAESSAAHEHAGTGLGLPISRKLCRLMEGDIEARSEPGRGTRMRAWIRRLRLPDGSAQRMRGRAEDAANESCPRLSVLVIDDDGATLELSSRTLTREGFSVITAASGREGIELARELQPDVITLDLIMPEMDGWAVLAELKADAATSSLPVILVTMLDERERGLALGASEFMTKPVEREALVKVLRRLRSDLGTAMVVEDEAPLRELLRRVLEAESWKVIEAQNGREALELVQQGFPDVVILDLLMPEMDGFEFLRRMRALPGGHRVPVVIATSKDLTPEERDELQGRVETVIEKEGMSRECLLGEISSLARDFGHLHRALLRAHRGASPPDTD